MKILTLPTILLAAALAVPITVSAAAPGIRVPPSPVGQTPAQIAYWFPGWIYFDFKTGGHAMNAVVTGLTDNELFLLAKNVTANSTAAGLSSIHSIAAQYLDTPNLIRWQAAFGQALVNPAVSTYSPTVIAQPYFAHPALRAVVHAAPAAPATPADPFAYWNTPIEQMYLEYRTAPFANCNAMCAMAKVGAVIAPNVNLAWNFGQWIGSTFYNTMLGIDPSYGYDLVISYGQTGDMFGVPPSPGAQGYVENGDGTVTDGYGNVLPAPVSTSYGFIISSASGLFGTGYIYEPFTFFTEGCFWYENGCW